MLQGSSQPCHAAATGGPATPRSTSPRRSSSPAAAARKPWVVADWKHRVPESAGGSSPRSERGGGAACDAPQTARQAALVAERARQLETDFAGVHANIDRVLGRCKLLSEQLAGSSVTSRGRHHRISSSSGSLRAPSTPDVADATRRRPMHLTMRSGLLFEAPPCQQQQQACGSGAGSSRLVDLNPGFSFGCGQPQRAAAILRQHAQQQPAAGSAGGLTHRETLQAGIQVLTAEFHAAVMQRQHQEWLQRHSCWEASGSADIIPASWFGP